MHTYTPGPAPAGPATTTGGTMQRPTAPFPSGAARPLPAYVLAQVDQINAALQTQLDHELFVLHANSVLLSLNHNPKEN